MRFYRLMVSMHYECMYSSVRYIRGSVRFACVHFDFLMKRFNRGSCHSV